MRHSQLTSIIADYTYTVAVQNNWLIHQMDVYNAYVNVDLEEPIYATTSGIY